MSSSLAKPILLTLFFLTACQTDEDSRPKNGGADSAPAPTPDSDSATTEILPVPFEPWSREETPAPGSATFTEIFYNNPENPDAGWVEIYNPMAYTLDVSGWSLAEGITYTFPEGTRIPPQSYLVIAADPTQTPGALGPYSQQLSSGGERIELISNGGRRMDTLTYSDDAPWPVGADGSGHTLAKLRPTLASDHAENWTVSLQPGGTPGADNAADPDAPPTEVAVLAIDTTWRYDDSGDAPAETWADLDYDDSLWSEGQATFYAGDPVTEADATIRVTADNYYAVYAGDWDGSNLRLIAADTDGNWTTVETFSTPVTATDHLFVAAWEAPYDYGGPQMVIAEVEANGSLFGTTSATFEWVLGADGACPGTTPPDPAPDVATLAALTASATWAAPAVEASKDSDPWAWAISYAFDAETQYIWPDTFSDTSVTNTSNTYAWFRSNETMLASPGTTALSGPPTTTWFRTSFTFDHDPAATRLFAECSLDDGAVFYLNGVEVGRENMPTGTVDADTLALSEITEDTTVYLELPTTDLVWGLNVLAVEVHQASDPDADLLFGCTLTASITEASQDATVVLNEVAAGGASPFWAELQNVSGQDQDMTGMILAASDGAELVLSGTLGAGALDLVEPGAVEAGEVLFLYTADKSRLLDAIRVGDVGRGRDAMGAWDYTLTSTPGEENQLETTEDIVIHEIMYHEAPIVTADTFEERPEEWIELYNRGTEAIDLSGWSLVDAVTYTIPEGTVLAPNSYLVIANDAAAVQADFPDAWVIGDFDGALSNRGDRIVLSDELGNIADEVRYFDGGRWPDAADGGGASLELKSPWADNNNAASWAASDTLVYTSWQSYTIEGTANPSAVGPDGVWNELVMGLLDAGEVLIDDLSVIQDPSTNPVEILQNGSFDNVDHWRILGNHRHSEVIDDPDDPGNAVLRLVATGPTEHMHNHAETTLTQTLGTRTYRISFRARWVSGSNQLHTRLYFNRLPHTTLLTQPALAGTAGAANTRAEDNLGPSLADLRQSAAVPEPGEAVEISVQAQDPDGVARVTLWSSVAGGAWVGQEMSEVDGYYVASLEGQAAGTVLQFYVEAEDALGETAMFPAAGPDSRALIQVDAGDAATNGLHNFRLIMTDADSDWLLEDTNLMSNDFLGATVVYDESEVFYDVGVRAKGSQRGRPETARLGYGVRFNPEQLFRGSHSSVLVDRSEGVITGQREMLLNLVMMRAGVVSAEYNDLAYAVTPRPEHTGAVELQLDRSTGLMLDAQFEDGSSGLLYDYELIYYPYTTDDGTAEGLKLPQPDSVVGTSITDLGSDKESYRWNFMLQNNTSQDSYDPIITLGQTFALRGSDAFLEEVGDVIDVDLWMRAFAVATLAGAVDNYGGDSSQHNARFYARPDDQKLLYFPHDLDYFGGYNMAVVGNSDLWYLIQSPVYRRTYYQHLQDILSSAYNTDYLGAWCDELGALLSGQNFDSHCQFIADRAAWVETGSSDAVFQQFPSIDFMITTNGGADFTTSDASTVLEGQGWVNVREIWLNGQALAVTWLDGDTWQVTVPLVAGPNVIVLEAVDLGGMVIGSDTIQVTRP